LPTSISPPQNQHETKKVEKVDGGISQSEAAKRVKVSERLVRDAAKLRREASPEVVEQVVRGEKTIHAALDEMQQPEKEGFGKRGKDGKLRPAKYKPRKKTVAKNSEPEEPEDYIDLPYNHNGEFIKLALPLDAVSMSATINRRFRHEIREMREKIVKEVEGLAVIVKYLVYENYEEAND
jgi:hypothetical protein